MGEIYFDELKDDLSDITTIRLAGLDYNSIVDGEGLRLAIFVQGCPHQCPDCHNRHSWNYNEGAEMTIHDILAIIDNLPTYYQGITLTGGEPFLQEEACYLIVKHVKEKTKKDVWCYSGYTYEELKDQKRYLLKYIDVLVDGKYIKANKTFNKPYVGSSNQRIMKLNEGIFESIL